MARYGGTATSDRSWFDSSPQPSNGAGQCVLLYSHDTYGLGHFRRNSAIAHALLRQDRNARVAMLTGSSMAGSWRLPEGVEIMRMPGVVKVGVDDYRPLTARSMSALRTEREQIIASTLRQVQPDVFLVDHAPLGMKGELKWALELARHELPHTQIVLGLRDILDDPIAVRRSWAEQSIYQALRSFYDQILVYGCKELFDVTELYAFEPQVRRRTIFTGYIAKHEDLEPAPDRHIAWAWKSAHELSRVLVTGGGGGDAAELLIAFLRAWPSISRRSRAEAVLVTGPMMPVPDRREIDSLVGQLDRVDLVTSSSNMLHLIAAADVVVSMGGYNSMVESVSARRPLVVWPRTSPRREQLIRARLLERLGLARVVMSGPSAVNDLAIAVIKALEEPPPSAEAWRRIDLTGAERVAHLLLERPAKVLFW